MTCDICGTTKGDLVPLREEFKTADISHICHDCESVLNKQQSKILSVALQIKTSWFMRFMQELRNKKRRIKSEGL